MNLHIVIHIIFLIVSVSATDARSVAKTRCLTKCGDVSIPHPFGIGKGCYLGEWYEVTCNNNIIKKPFLSKINLEILRLDVEKYTLTVMIPVASNCQRRQKGNTIWSSANLTGSPFSFGTYDNKFVVVGCDSALLFVYYVFDSILADREAIGYSCLPRCEPGGSSVQGCQTLLPTYNGSYGTNFYTISVDEHKSIGCTYAFLIQSSADMSSINTTNQVPVVISDYRRNITSKKGDYDVACAKCKNDCYKNQETGDFQCGNRREIILGSSFGGGLLFLLLCGFCLWMYKVIKKKRMANLKKKFFKRNGGLLLEQQISSDEGMVTKTILFTSDELLKATDNYNEDRVLGQGGQGTVYKGMLTDGRITAVKKSNLIDESQLGQFINEVIILSQMDHRNIVKLLGCCLETEVPLLVYEFVLNGTLSDLVHNANEEFPLSWKMRLRIATQVAGALAYLHSASSMPIYHRDIKSTNILLDEKFRAKISDFGTSRTITIEQSHLTTAVYGTLGYLDPEYFQSSQFTDKSDVYSFGVVLAELLTGQKAISLSESEEERSLAARFVMYAEQMRVFDIVDARVLEDAPKEEILAVSDIARRCMNLNGKMRPTMKEVATDLEVMSREPVVAAAPSTILNQETFDIEMRRNRLEDRYSTSTMIMSDYETFPSSETDPLIFYSQ